MQAFIDRIQEEPFVLLVIFIAVPFLLVNALVYPLSQGVHGTVHSDYGNDVRFDGTIDGIPYNGTDPPTSGHFKGDLYIGENTGWVICNGEVRFSGTLVIRDAELDYNIRSNRSVTAPGNTVRMEKDYKHIALDGTDGEMEDGVPIWFLGFIGSAAGAAAWAAWFIFRRRTRHDRTAAIVLLTLGLMSAYNITFLGPLFSPICVMFMAVPVIFVLILALIRPFREDLVMMRVDLRRSGIPEVLMLAGAVVVVISAAMVVHCGWGSFDGYQHDPSTAWRNLAFGITGLLVGGADIGFGLGKHHQRKRTPRRRNVQIGRKRLSKAGDTGAANVYGLKDFRSLDVPPPPGKRGRRKRRPPPPES